jgi:hypothetical protein
MRETFDFITYWSQRFIMEILSVWVQERGGWVRYTRLQMLIRTLNTSSCDHSVRRCLNFLNIDLTDKETSHTQNSIPFPWEESRTRMIDCALLSDV